MKYYLIGIKGTGMSTLANILSDLGNDVSGYDDDHHFKYTEEGLKKRGIEIYYDGSKNLDKDTIVTYSKAFKDDHPEIKRAKEAGITLKEYNQVVGDLTKEFETISVCGTHGKTTTTLLCSEVLKDKGVNYFVGDGSGYANKDNKLLVIESDEYNKHLLAYHPHIAVLTSIELDHTECYPGGVREIQETFKEFMEKAKVRVACGDYKTIRELELDDVIYYGINDGNDIQARNIQYNKDGSSFDLYENGEFIHHFNTKMYGEYMILNSLATITVARLYEVDLEKIEEVLQNFEGAKRRFKIREFGDISVISDYAHHPTAIKLTLEAVRQKYPDKENIAVFLPNTYSRTIDLLDEFIESLKLADKAYVLDIRSNREKQEDFPNVNSDLIIDKVEGAEKIAIDDPEKLLRHKNAAISFMSCGDIYLLEDELVKALENK